MLNEINRHALLANLLGWISGSQERKTS